MNPLPDRVLLGLVALGVLAAALRQIAGDALSPALAQAIELATFFGLLAALMMFLKAARGDRAPRPAGGNPIKTTTLRVNALAVVTVVAVSIVIGGLAGIDPELLKLFSTGAFMLAKDIVQSDKGG